MIHLARHVSFLVCFIPLMVLNPVNAHALDEKNIELLDLNGSFEFRTHIAEGVSLWVQSQEHALRYLMIKRCSVYDRKFPAKASPNLVKILDVFNDEVKRAIADGVAQDSSMQWLTEIKPVYAALLEHKYSSIELADWNKFRNSLTGRRAIALFEMHQAIGVVAGALVDIRSGVPWSWPLAHLRDFSDSKNLRNEFNRAIDQVLPRTSQLLIGISSVPGEQQDVIEFSRNFFDRSALIQEAFLQSLSIEDKGAYQELLNQSVYQSGLMLFSSLVPVISQSVIKDSSQSTATELCTALKVKGCTSDSKLGKRLSKYRDMFAASLNSMPFEATLKRLTSSIAEAGCP